jgi:Na+-transporting methylmalonyl-CoA/oxaloacetate decarboxylase gamma subunit
MSSNLINFVTLFFSISAFVLATIAYFKSRSGKVYEYENEKSKKKNKKEEKDEEEEDEDNTKEVMSQIESKSFNPFD